MIDSSSPNQPIQNYEIVNSGLEAQVAALLPSVAGYGGNLRSTNTIIPVVDLTAAAEGSNVPESLQQALAFGSQTAFEITSGTTALANTPGFWRLIGVVSGYVSGTNIRQATFDMSDGVSTKEVWNARFLNGVTATNIAIPFDFIVFLAAGESISGTIVDTGLTIGGSYRQVATLDGTLVTPSGF
tara:strand:- start:180 stop:734 length:555 start_codon:yes stop_codon:yes gene_type:complete